MHRGSFWTGAADRIMSGRAFLVLLSGDRPDRDRSDPSEAKINGINLSASEYALVTKWDK